MNDRLLKTLALLSESRQKAVYRYDHWGDDHGSCIIYGIEFWIFVCASDTAGSEKRSRL